MYGKELNGLQSSKLWTKDFVLFIGSNFFVGLAFYTLMTTVTLYTIQQFSASQSQGGLASSIFIIGALLARLVAGKLVEKVGRKKMMYNSLLLFFLAMLLYFFVDNLALLFVVRFIHGVGFGFANTAMTTTVMDAIPTNRRGEGTGYYSLSTTASTAIGPFVGIYLMNHADFTSILYCCTFCAAAAMGFALLAKVKEADLTSEERKNIKLGFNVSDFFEKKAIPIAVITVFMGIAYSSIMSFINLYAYEIELVDAASYFFLIYAIFLFVTRPLAGKLLDQKGDNFIMYPCILLFSVSLFVVSYAHSSFILLLASALLAFGFGTYMSSAQAIAAKVAPPKNIGLAISTFYIGLDFGIGIGPFLLGFVIPLVGFRTLYALLGILVLILLGAYFMLHGSKVKQLYSN